MWVWAGLYSHGMWVRNCDVLGQNDLCYWAVTDSDRTMEDILGSCLVRSTNLLALLRTLARAEAFEGTPADCLEAVEELMARLVEDIDEAHDTYEGRVRNTTTT